MNWSTVKNLLIFMLVAANLFLVYNIVMQQRTLGYIDREEVDAALDILSQRGYKVDSDVIPLERFGGVIYECNYGDEYFESTAVDLFGSDYDKLTMLPDGIRIIGKKGDTIEFDNGFGFFFLSNNHSENSAYTDITAGNFYEKAADAEVLSKSKFTTLSVKAAAFLQSSAPNETRLGAEAVSGFISGKLSCILLEQTADGVPIYNHRAVCFFEGDDLVACSGNWYFSGVDTTYDCEVSDQVNILFTDADNIASDNTKNEDGSGMAAIETEVEKLSSCYAIYWNAEKTKLFFIPAWQIAHKSGETSVYNATDSTIYLSNK